MARVMVLEDDPNLRRFITIFLASRGHEVAFEGGSGHVGLIHLAKHPDSVDVVLSDLRMPIADGLDVLAGVRSLGGSPKRVVLASAFWSEEEVELARDLGADHLLAKPFDLDRLLSAIANPVKCEV